MPPTSTPSEDLPFGSDASDEPSRLFYVQGSPAARLVERLPATYLRTAVSASGGDASRVTGPGVLLIDASRAEFERAARLETQPHALAVIAVGEAEDLAVLPLGHVDAWLAPDAPAPIVAQTVANAFETLRLRADVQRAGRELRRLTAEFQLLNAIGIKLSAESDTEALLELILMKAREITQSDAGSLYLVEADAAGAPRLRFSLVQNDSFPVGFRGSTLPVTSRSVAGHVALTGQALSLDDAYAPPAGSPFQIDRAYDEDTGYRSKSMLVVPMKTPKDEVIGVLQLINCKRDPARRFGSRDEIERETVPFPARFQDLASSLASQAAVALEKSRLYRELRTALDELESSHQRIIQTERLMALGEMAGGIAHDFNNVLAIILGRAQLLLGQVGDPELQRQIRVIQKAAVDGAQTVRRMQEFTRIRRARPFQAVDLNQVVHAVVELTRCRWRDQAQARGIAYDIRLETTPVPPVAGDSAELREALINLLFNAFDAMPRGGRLTITTGFDGERVRASVTDSGSGMTDEVRRRVFEPFFTTKGQKGSGLGLSVTWGIVARHGGSAEVESAVERGSTFTIKLPVARDLAPPREPDAPDPPRRPLNVLVIDDEPEVRQVLVDLLARRGHHVVACGDGQAGLERFQHEPFDLVITDLGMPGLSGWEVAGAIKHRSPHTPVALVTGWGDQLDAEDARTRGVDFVVAKPFRIEQVLAVLGHTIAGD